MRIELMPGLTNVVRFPVERRARPSLHLLRDIAPDIREVLTVAEGFAMTPPVHDLRDRTDAETGAHIAAQIPAKAPDRERQAQLDELLNPIVERAVAACRHAHDVAVAASAAQRRLVEAEIAGGYWLKPLTEKAEHLTEQAAVLLVEAHARVEEAEGVARAVNLAKRSAPWTPRNHKAEDDELIAMGKRRAG